MFSIGFTYSDTLFLICIVAIIVMPVQCVFCFTAERRWVRMLPLLLMPLAIGSIFRSMTIPGFAEDFWGGCGWGYLVGEGVSWLVFLLPEKWDNAHQ